MALHLFPHCLTSIAPMLVSYFNKYTSILFYLFKSQQSVSPYSNRKRIDYPSRDFALLNPHPSLRFSKQDIAEKSNNLVFSLVEL